MTAFETAKSNVAAYSYGPGAARQLITMEAIVAITTAMIDNTADDVGLFYLPEGAVIVGICASATDMDTNGAPTLAFDIGDSADEDRLMAASVIGQAATLSQTLARAGHLHKYTTRTQIRAYVQAVAATGAAGTLKVNVIYFVDPQFSTDALTAS